MTIYDISEKAGVSIATVSRVLNGSSSVSEKTRQKVLDVMEACDYTPNAFARGLGLNTMNTIGLLCTNCSDLYLSKAVYYIEQGLRANHYDALLYCTGQDKESKENALKFLLSKKVDGIILIGSDFISEKAEDNSYIQEAAKELPIMLFDAVLDAPNVYSIASDDFQSTYEATLALLSAGVKDILFFYQAASYSDSRKLAGHKEAMSKMGLPISPSLALAFSGSLENINAMVDTLQNASKSGTTFHSIIASNDTLALAALKYAKQENLKVPEQFSIIGYNNSMLTSCCDPELTSIDNKIETLCGELITLLMEVLAGNPVPQKTMLSGELVKRGTTTF